MNNKLEISEIKTRVLKLLKYLDMICTEENIPYSLCYGSLLGAVRHKGFIPWDDDVDVCLKRCDYEKLISVLDIDNNDKYKMINMNNNNTYYYNFSKLVDTETVVYENGYYPIKDYGIYIDIFPVDNVPSNKMEFDKYIKKINFLSAMKSVSVTTDFLKNILTKKGLTKLFCMPLAKIFGKDFWVKAIDKMLKKYNISDTGYICCLTEYPKYSEVMPSNVFENLTDVRFEDCYFKGFANYDRYLKNRYGNYMELPPADKRISNHNYEAYLKKG